MDLFAWMMHPAMLAAGAAAVSLPVIIHLLNRRRFRTVEWAAMDFLLEADKKNRKRVQLENLILLLLRCLAVLLLGLLLSRPFLPGMLASLLNQKQKIERVVLLDDSLSQLAPRGEVSGFVAARESLLQWLNDAATSTESDHWLTLYLTSQPDQPLLSWEPVTVATLPALGEQIRGLECTRQRADYAASLTEISRYLAGQREGTGRAVCLLTDLRQQDWLAADAESGAPALPGLLEQIARLSNRRLVIDCGSDRTGNLAIVDVRSEDLLVANRSLRIDVSVANFGPEAIEDVPVLLSIDGGAPLRDSLDSIGPGQTRTLTFQHLFLPDPRSPASLALDPAARSLIGPSGVRNHRLEASIDRSSLSAADLERDQLPDDSARPMAVRLLDGIPVLLVDGDPSPLPERSETHYLRSLNVFGTGMLTSVVTPTDLESISLGDYRVIFLCNVDEISQDRVKLLEQWVREGGAVVLMPGNQVRAAVFNETFYREGAGLSPVALERIDGDPSLATWVNFEPDAAVHPALRTVLTSDATGLTRVDVFSWWKTQPIAESLVSQTATAMRLSDASNSPAMLDRSLGKGRVIFFNIPADGDWTLWPAVTGSWVPVMLDLVDYLAGSIAASSELRIGDSVRWPIDLSAYQSRVVLRDPGQEKTETVARLPESESGSGPETRLAVAEFPPIRTAGFHELGLQRIDGQTETVLFTAGLPREESRLQRLDPERARSELFGEDWEFGQPETRFDQQVRGASAEIWPYVVGFLLAVLGLEQFLAWWFARRREAPVSGGVA